MQIKVFQKTVWQHYRTSGRHGLPWRKTRDAYKILVSEVMLQQTQVGRVIPKYKEFLQRFPTLTALATAPLAEVLRVWQGLGYNRRAKYIHALATVVVQQHKGKLPASEIELLKLPGIGKATAAAILAFAFNKPVVYLETNVRSVFLHYFFANKDAVPDIQLLPLIEKAAKGQDPRAWNWALLDYGTHLKSIHQNPNRSSKHYIKQTKFQGSNREIRGTILRVLDQGPLTRSMLIKTLGDEAERYTQIVCDLLKEGLITESKRLIRLG